MAEMDHYIAIVATSHINDFAEHLATKSTEHDTIQSRLHNCQLSHEATKKDLDLSRANEQHTAGSVAVLQQWVDDLLVELDDSKRAERERVDKLQASVQEKTEAIQAQRTLATSADEERADEDYVRPGEGKVGSSDQGEKDHGSNSEIELNKRARKIESLELELSAALTTQRSTTNKDTSMLEQKIQALTDQNVTLNEKDEAPQLRNDLCCMTRIKDGLAQELAVSAKKIRSLESNIQAQQRTITAQTSLLSDRERRIHQLKAVLRSVSALRPR
ncbi:hypothetical protein LTR17_004015 [Elasticomyces elasticus]|nr:hypothetical protein LTR17_004015 [Elasticomyces elasticus]